MPPLNLFIVFLVLFEFTVYMANDLIMPGMIQVVHEFQASERFIPLSLSVYLLGGMTLQWVMGPVSDRLGRRPSMIFGCAFFSVCTLLITFTYSISSFLGMRFFQGMGLAFIPVCGYAAVQECFEEKKAVRVIAWMNTVALLAPILGPILGGFFVKLLNWRWIFIFLLLCSLISTTGIWQSMPGASPRLIKQRQRIPIFESLKKATLESLQTYVRILKNRQILQGSFVNGLLGVPILCWIAVSPLILFERAHISPELYGAVQIPIFGCYMLGSAILRRLTHGRSLMEIIRIGVPICIASVFAFGAIIHIYPNSYWSYVIPLSFYCIGAGITSAPLTRKTLYASDESKGSVSAVFQFITSTVLIFSISLMPLIFSPN
jgi:DHA1 family multidrug/chloramphenicol efflux transport protein-like MFS transporter